LVGGKLFGEEDG
jgi:hypothetical protein